jgi:hypothetical protein
LRRFALIASSNDGGRSRVTLRFADSDARSMADVLRELGGLRQSDLILLTGATRSSLQAAFARLRILLAAAPPDAARREILIYYSGHSDQEGLLLGDERVSYAELRQLINGTDADVRIAILDSCASGSLIRLRGVIRRPAFLSDLSSNARGDAFLMASSADEPAQESDRVGAAFFTHSLVSGLRGGADASGDGLITLAEAYQFAYHEVLARTERTAAAAQHPTYDFRLAGQGDLVLTDLRSTSAILVLAEDVAGRVYVRNAGGRLVVELRKGTPHRMRLALGPGSYRVALEDNGPIRQAAVTLAHGQTPSLSRAQFLDVPVQPTVTRGGASGPQRPGLGRSLLGSSSLLGQMTAIGAYAGVAPRYTRLGGGDAFIMNLEVALLFGRRLALGVMSGGGQGGPTSAAGSAYTLSYGAIAARYHIGCDSSAFCLSLGASGGAGDANLVPPGAGTGPRSTRDDLFLFEPQLGGHLMVARFFRLGVDLGYRLVAGAERYPIRDLAGPTAGFHLQLGWF